MYDIVFCGTLKKNINCHCIRKTRFIWQLCTRNVSRALSPESTTTADDDGDRGNKRREEGGHTPTILEKGERERERERPSLAAKLPPPTPTPPWAIFTCCWSPASLFFGPIGLSLCGRRRRRRFYGVCWTVRVGIGKGRKETVERGTQLEEEEEEEVASMSN